MVIEKLEISQFRNLESVSIFPSPHLNVIVGKNASGKTSFLESLYFLATARSFRTLHSKQLISFGFDHFLLFASITNEGTTFGIGVKKDRENIVLKVANKVINSAAQLAELVPMQLINPDVHKLLEDGPRHRRKFIEWGVFHVKPKYHVLWQQCRHILKQRNAALRQQRNNNEIRHWDQLLCEATEQISEIRKQYVLDLVPHVRDLLDRMAGFPEIELRLEQGWPKHQSYLETLQACLDSDRQRGFTQFGPHRADLAILAQGVAAKNIVSRGQQKMLTALMKLAQVNLLKQKGKSPIVLVDDLASELDDYFCDALMNEVVRNSTQVFVTSTDRDFSRPFFINRDAKMFHVEQGQFSELI